MNFLGTIFSARSVKNYTYLTHIVGVNFKWINNDALKTNAVRYELKYSMLYVDTDIIRAFPNYAV